MPWSSGPRNDPNPGRTTQEITQVSAGVLANKRDVPYQSLLKLFLAERLEEELQRLGAADVKT